MVNCPCCGRELQKIRGKVKFCAQIGNDNQSCITEDGHKTQKFDE